MRKQWMLGVGLFAAVTLAGLGCNPVADDNRSAVTMVAAFEDPFVGFTFDVVQDSAEPADDFADITVGTIAKNTSSSISDFYTVQLLAYEVTFTRIDGRNTPGVDVPFPFTLAVGGTVSPEGETVLNLPFVTKEMKLEAPLRNLWFGDGKRLMVTMQVTVFGRDRVGNSLSATASAPIIFEDLPG